MKPDTLPLAMHAWPRSLSRPGVSQLVVAAVFVIAYVALEWVSFIHEYKGLPVTPWNPGTGAALALMILGGLRYGFALFAGIVAAEIVLLQSELGWPEIAGIGAIISSGYALAAIIWSRLKPDAGLTHLRDVIVLLAVGIGAAALVSLCLTAVLVAVDQLDPPDIVFASGTFLIGDLIGIAVVTPILLRIVERFRQGRFRDFLPPVRDVAPLGGLIAAALWAIGATESDEGFKLFYLLFLPVVVAAIRHGLDGACLSLAATQLGLVGLLHLQDYEARIFTEFQMLMFVLTATGLIVGAIVSERREAEEQLKQKQAEATHAARFSLVSGLASALAHEVNQPMTAARALARSAQELMRTPGGDLARASSNLATLIAEIDHAGGIVRRMRDFLRRGQPHFSTLDIHAMVDDALALIRPEAEARHVALAVEMPADLPAIHGDRVQLQQVILNLVRNAIDSIVGAGIAEGRVAVAVRPADRAGRIEIAVSDNGAGIAPELAARLFEPLTSSKKEGLGLGLSICRAIIDAHGGRLWLQSGQAGATEFRFSLPFETPTGRA